MNKYTQHFFLIIFSSFIVLIFKYNYILEKTVLTSVNLWLTKVFPNLFIMFIIQNLIINTNVLNNISKLISPIFNKIFHTKGNSCIAFLLSIISGTPASSFIIKEMLDKNQIDEEDANKLIKFTFFGSPLFLYNNLSYFLSKGTSIKIIIIHYITNVVIGFITRGKKSTHNIANTKDEKNINNIFILLPSAIKKSLDTLLIILGTIIFYMLITNIIFSIFNISLTVSAIIKGLLEMTQGINSIHTIKINGIIKEIILLNIISFGGLAIHTQVLSIINDTKISYKNFFWGRILHMLISTCAYLLISLYSIS